MVNPPLPARRWNCERRAGEGDGDGEGLGAEQGSVTGQDQDDRVVVVVAVEARHPDRSRIARPFLLDLLGESDPSPLGGQAGHLLGHQISPVSDHDHGRGRSHRLEGVDDVQQHRSTTDRVEGFGGAGPHPGSDTGREDDGRDVHVVPGRGLEPLHAAPKTAVLPIRRPRTVSRISG